MHKDLHMIRDYKKMKSKPVLHYSENKVIEFSKENCTKQQQLRNSIRIKMQKIEISLNLNKIKLGILFNVTTPFYRPLG